jgi:hypothetical protein
MDTVEAGFVAGDEREGAGFVGEAAEGSRYLIAGVRGFGLGVGWKVLAVHFTIEERGFDRAQTLDAPAGGDHLVHQTLFDRGAGLIGGGIIGEHFLEFVVTFTFEDHSFPHNESVGDGIMW